MKKIDNPIMADAFSKTEGGKVLVFQAKAIGIRVHDIKELAHSTIMEMTRNTHWYKKRFYQLMSDRKKAGKSSVGSPFDLFKAAKPVLREIAARGENAKYKSALMTLQFTWSSRKTLTDTVEMILG